MNRLGAVIFDMDGVLVDSESRHELAFVNTIAAIGYTGRHGLKFADYVGRSDVELWIDFLSRHACDYTLDQLLAMKRDRVIEILRRDQPLFDGVVNVVSALARHYPLALASGSERAVVNTVLELGGLGSYFETTVSCSEVRNGKPAPDIFLKAAASLGVPAERCWVIEDSTAGVTAALAAGMRVIAITNTYPHEKLASATHVVSSCGEILPLLLPPETI